MRSRGPQRPIMPLQGLVVPTTTTTTTTTTGWWWGWGWGMLLLLFGSPTLVPTATATYYNSLLSEPTRNVAASHYYYHDDDDDNDDDERIQQRQPKLPPIVSYFSPQPQPHAPLPVISRRRWHIRTASSCSSGSRPPCCAFGHLALFSWLSKRDGTTTTTTFMMKHPRITVVATTTAITRSYSPRTQRPCAYYLGHSRLFFSTSQPQPPKDDDDDDDDDDGNKNNDEPQVDETKTQWTIPSMMVGTDSSSLSSSSSSLLSSTSSLYQRAMQSSSSSSRQYAHPTSLRQAQMQQIMSELLSIMASATNNHNHNNDRDAMDRILQDHRDVLLAPFVSNNDDNDDSFCDDDDPNSIYQGATTPRERFERYQTVMQQRIGAARHSSVRRALQAMRDFVVREITTAASATRTTTNATSTFTNQNKDKEKE